MLSAGPAGMLAGLALLLRLLLLCLRHVVHGWGSHVGRGSLPTLRLRLRVALRLRLAVHWGTGWSRRGGPAAGGGQLDGFVPRQRRLDGQRARHKAGRSWQGLVQALHLGPLEVLRVLLQGGAIQMLLQGCVRHLVPQRGCPTPRGGPAARVVVGAWGGASGAASCGWAGHQQARGVQGPGCSQALQWGRSGHVGRQ